MRKVLLLEESQQANIDEITELENYQLATLNEKIRYQ